MWMRVGYTAAVALIRFALRLPVMYAANTVLQTRLSAALVTLLQISERRSARGPSQEKNRFRLIWSHSARRIRIGIAANEIPETAASDDK